MWATRSRRLWRNVQMYRGMLMIVEGQVVSAVRRKMALTRAIYTSFGVPFLFFCFSSLPSSSRKWECQFGSRRHLSFWNARKWKGEWKAALGKRRNKTMFFCFFRVASPFPAEYRRSTLFLVSWKTIVLVSCPTGHEERFHVTPGKCELDRFGCH